MITPADKATTPGTAAPGSGRVGVPAARGGLEPGVTIVVIGRDEEAHLPGCFDAIAALDYPHERLEILYVDSGSRDASVRIAAEAGARVIEAGSRVRSAGQARNVGWRAAENDIVHFIDGDVFVDRDYLRAALAVLGFDGVACVFGRLAERRAATDWTARVLATDWRTKQAGDVIAPGAGATFLRCVLQEVDGYDESAVVGEETDMGRRLRTAGHRIVLLDVVMGTHDYGVVGVGGLLARYFRLGRGFGTLVAAGGPGGRDLARPGRKLLAQGGAALAGAVALRVAGRLRWLLALVPAASVALLPFVLVRYRRPLRAGKLGASGVTYYYLNYAAKPVLLAGVVCSLLQRLVRDREAAA